MATVRLSCRALSLFSLLLIGPWAGAEEPAAGSNDVRHLELGDVYQVVVRREGVEAIYGGQLVQITDDWIVLCSIGEMVSERDVPAATNVPYLDELLENARIHRIIIRHWIPRDAINVIGRVIIEDKKDFERLAAAEPPWKEAPRIVFAEKGEREECVGPIEFDGETLRCDTLIFEEKRVPVPVLGYLPKWGVLFTTTELELREGVREVPISRLLSVEEQTPAKRDSTHQGAKNSSSMRR